jgi:hypothetical protein
LLADSGISGLLLYRKRFKAILPFATNQDPLISTAAGSMPAQWFRASEVSLGKENIGPIHDSVWFRAALRQVSNLND